MQHGDKGKLRVGIFLFTGNVEPLGALICGASSEKKKIHLDYHSLIINSIQEVATVLDIT